MIISIDLLLKGHCCLFCVPFS